MLHRDVKPGNIIVGKHGETLVVDWGLAKPLGRSEPGNETGERTLVPSSTSGKSETLPGSALGTPAYMSPEQARGELDRLVPRSDVYSLGATLYYVLTGRPPYNGDDGGEILRRAQSGDFARPGQLDPAIDKAIEAICLKAMAAEPQDRYATARALVDDLERWAADEPITAWSEPLAGRARRWARRNRTAVTTAAAVVLVALAGTAVVLAVQTRANAALMRANAALTAANAREARANADLAAANDREQARFALAMDAIGLFHGEVSEDLLLKQKPFESLRQEALAGGGRVLWQARELAQGPGRRHVAHGPGAGLRRAGAP